MGSFLSELKRRHIYRVAAAYAVVAWVLVQLVNNLAPAFELPSWVTRAVVLILIIGLPVVLIFAWVQQLAPAAEAGAQPPTNKLDAALISALIVVVALFGYQQFASSPATQSSVDSARRAAASPATALSIAVLPFTNLSGDTSQEFFSDGMTEEITTALAKVPDLRVVGRTSAFQYKGQNQDLRAIGQSLSATHLIEGSVRKVGDRVRITAQLIKADDGTHIWAENYDRQLTDVFAIQEDIARAITASLRMPLGLKPGENLVNNRSIDPESYEKVLRLKAMLEARGGVPEEEARLNYTEAVELAEAVTAKNPNYAPGWPLLAQGYLALALNRAAGLNPEQARSATSDLRAKVEAALKHAIQLDPDLASAYSLLGWLERSRGNFIEGEDLIKKSLALDPFSPDTLFVGGMLSGTAGRLKEALDFSEKGHAIDPLYPNLARQTVTNRGLNGRFEDAIALAKTLRPIDRATYLAEIYLFMGRYGEAADALMELAAGDSNSDAAQAARLLRAGSVKTAPKELPRLRAGLVPFYVYLGAPERSLEEYERRVAAGFLNGSQSFVWAPAYASVRKTERFKALMRKVGLVDYWRAKGWPPQCHPTTADDFECS